MAPPVILGMDVHCLGCARKIRKLIKDMYGVENVWASPDTELVVVAGTADAHALKRRIESKMQRAVTIVSDGEEAPPVSWPLAHVPQHPYAPPPPPQGYLPCAGMAPPHYVAPPQGYPPYPSGIESKMARAVTIVSDGAEVPPANWPSLAHLAPPPYAPPTQGYRMAPCHYAMPPQGYPHYQGMAHLAPPHYATPPPPPHYPYGGGWQHDNPVNWAPAGQYMPNEAPVWFNDEYTNGGCSIL